MLFKTNLDRSATHTEESAPLSYAAKIIISSETSVLEFTNVSLHGNVMSITIESMKSSKGVGENGNGVDDYRLVVVLLLSLSLYAP